MAVVRPQGSRIEWTDVAEPVRDLVTERLGTSVVAAVNEPGGFSPGVAARCRLADGRRCFIKAVSSDQNPVSPGMHRREAQVAAQLPDGLPVPVLWELVDDGNWVVLVFEEIHGSQPRMPWTWADLKGVFTTLDTLAEATTPCPIRDLAPCSEYLQTTFTNFRNLAGGDPLVDEIDPWTRIHLDLLADLEAGWETAAAGESLLHADVRADNLLVRPDGSLVLVDWPHACAGAPWADKVFFLPSVAVEGGPAPGDIEKKLGPLAGVDPHSVNCVLAAVAGLFTVHGLWPDPPGLPTVRAFQQAQGQVARQWLAWRLRLWE